MNYTDMHVEKINKVLRWAVRRDAEAGATMFGGFIQSAQPFIATVVGIESGLKNGLLVFAGLFIIKCIAGRIDLLLGATAYRNHYVSSIAPMNVKVIKEDSNSA